MPSRLLKLTLVLYILSLLVGISVALTPQLESNALEFKVLAYDDGDLLNLENQTIYLASQKARENNPQQRPIVKRKLAAGGGAVLTSLPPTQYPTVTFAGSLFTIGASTSATWKDFTQTFAATALGSWALGPTPRPGTIGLGTIHGSIGGRKSVTKRAMQTPRPRPW